MRPEVASGQCFAKNGAGPTKKIYDNSTWFLDPIATRDHPQAFAFERSFGIQSQGVAA